MIIFPENVNESLASHFAGYQMSYTVHIGISMVYKGSPITTLLFALHHFPFSMNYFLPSGLCDLHVVIPAPSCSTIKQSLENFREVLRWYP